MSNKRDKPCKMWCWRRKMKLSWIKKIKKFSGNEMNKEES